MKRSNSGILKGRKKRGEKSASAVSKTADRLFTLILLAIMFAGIIIMLYPSLSDYWNLFHQSRAILTYADNVAGMNEETYRKLQHEADLYNRMISKSGITWKLTEKEREDYNSRLNFDGTGVMGYITIQKINCRLPIYHGTEDNVLQTAIGHLEGSSLPVGGESTHCLLSGHRGLPSARLFTDLDKLREGDTFTLTILNETLTYEVDHIWIIEPEDLSYLQIEKGKDLCTLITCTPYGINSHRLLVRGHRIANADGDAMIIADAIQIRPVFIAPFLAVPILLLLLVYVLIGTTARRRSGKDRKTKYLEERSLEEPVLEPENPDEFMEVIRSIVDSRKRKE